MVKVFIFGGLCEGLHFFFFLLSEGLREVETHWVLPEQGVCLHSLTLMDLSRPSSVLSEKNV